MNDKSAARLEIFDGTRQVSTTEKHQSPNGDSVSTFASF